MRISCFVAAIGLCAAIAVPAPAQDFGGDYTLTFYIGPHNELGGSYCAQLTVDHSFPSFENSGTWTYTDLSDWSGEYFVDRGELRLFATITGNNETETWAIDFPNTKDGATGGWDNHIATVPPQPDQAGTVVLNSGCAPGRRTKLPLME